MAPTGAVVPLGLLIENEWEMLRFCCSARFHGWFSTHWSVWFIFRTICLSAGEKMNK